MIYQSEEYPNDGTLGASSGLFKTITYSDYEISHNEQLNKYILRPSPTIKFSGNKDKYYTICMVDLDEPSPNNPALSEWRHWLVINIPGNGIINDRVGDQITPYQSPDPVTGKHRYMFKLYEQSDIFSIKIDEKRNNWDSTHFAKQLGLKNKGMVQILSSE
jgi:phosphatidylethanolamine-binding protein (PEBP) family uncharacterized protein